LAARFWLSRSIPEGNGLKTSHTTDTDDTGSSGDRQGFLEMPDFPDSCVEKHLTTGRFHPFSAIASAAKLADDSDSRKQQLVEFFHELEDCQKCALAEGRTTVVFGSGDPDANLMFVGEAPGFHEDKQGKPFVGQAGKLLDKLLAEIGLERKQVWISNVLKCRPPGNRDPQPAEIEACQGHLFKQIGLIEPRVICSLGNFSTKLLSGSQEGITKVRGVPQSHQFGGHDVLLFPIFHPAAALYTPAMLEQLRADFGKLPGLIEQAQPAEPQAPPEPERAPEPEQEAVEVEVELALAAAASVPEAEVTPQDQLGLF
jgi:DNA polymerase